VRWTTDGALIVFARLWRRCTLVRELTGVSSENSGGSENTSTAASASTVHSYCYPLILGFDSRSGHSARSRNGAHSFAATRRSTSTGVTSYVQSNVFSLKSQGPACFRRRTIAPVPNSFCRYLQGASETGRALYLVVLFSARGATFAKLPDHFHDVSVRHFVWTLLRRDTSDCRKTAYHLLCVRLRTYRKRCVWHTSAEALIAVGRRFRYVRTRAVGGNSDTTSRRDRSTGLGFGAHGSPLSHRAIGPE
jgi:hypothetical protein